MSYSFDASSVIHLWENYPAQNDHFKSLWESFVENLNNGTFSISDVALKEIKDKIPDFEERVQPKPNPEQKNITDLQIVQDIKDNLGIEEDKYHPKGVNENNLFIIAVTKRNNHILVSEEAVQNNLPVEKSKYKIPAVCKEIAKIECADIQTLLNKNIL